MEASSSTGSRPDRASRIGILISANPPVYRLSRELPLANIRIIRLRHSKAERGTNRPFLHCIATNETVRIAAIATGSPILRPMTSHTRCRTTNIETRIISVIALKPPNCDINSIVSIGNHSPMDHN